MIKRLIRTVVGSFFLSMILAMVMGLLVFTLRWRHKGRAELKSRLRSGKPEIIIFWHEHLFVMSPVLPRHCSALQSPHPDGRVLAGASRLFGLRPIWGSSNRKALSGLRQMASELKSGRSAVITPDGPRGPARTLSMGPISLSQLSGAPITIVAWSAQNCWRAKSWDRMRFPKPFSPITCKWSKPIILPRTKSKTELEQQRLLIEAQLNKLVSSVDDSYLDGQVT